MAQSNASELLSRFASRIVAAQEGANALATQLDHAAAKLRDTGEPIPAALNDAARAHRQEVLDIQNDLTELGNGFGSRIQVRADPNHVMLKSQLKWLEGRLRDKESRTAAIEILSEAGTLRVLREDKGTLLEPYYRAVHDVKGAVSESNVHANNNVVDEIISRTHSVVALLDLVRASNAPYSSAIEQLWKRTQDAFGPEIAWAGMRGQLGWLTVEEPRPPSVVAIDESATLQSEATGIMTQHRDLGGEAPEAAAHDVTGQATANNEQPLTVVPRADEPQPPSVVGIDESAMIFQSEATEIMTEHHGLGEIPEPAAHDVTGQATANNKQLFTVVPRADEARPAPVVAIDESAMTFQSEATEILTQDHGLGGEMPEAAAHDVTRQASANNEQLVTVLPRADHAGRPFGPGEPTEHAKFQTSFDAEVLNLAATLETEATPTLRPAASITHEDSISTTPKLTHELQSHRADDPSLESRAHLFGPRSHQHREKHPASELKDVSQLESTPLAELPESLDSVDLARQLLKSQKPRRSEFLVLVFRLISEGRLALAFQFADYIAAVWPKRRPTVHPLLLATIVISTELSDTTGSLSQALVELLPEITNHVGEEGDESWQFAMHLLMIAGTLKPCLLLPSPPAIDLLSNSSAKCAAMFPHTSKLCDSVIEFGYLGSGLDLALLQTAKSAAAWRDDLENLHEELSGWWSQAERAKIWQAATAVWMRWLRPGGVLYELLEPVRGNDSTHIENVAERLAALSKSSRLRSAIHDTDRRVIGRLRGDDIHSGALVSLEKHTQPALAFARRWLQLQRQRPEALETNIPREQALKHRARLAEIEKLRQRVNSDGPRACTELEDSLKTRVHTDPLVAGTRQLIRAISQVGDLLDSSKALLTIEPDLAHALHGVLLTSPRVRLREDWTPVDSPGDPSDLLNLAARPDIDWSAAFVSAEQRGDHATTRRIVEYLSARNELTGDFKGWPERRQSAVEERRKRLVVHLYDEEAHIEEAAVLGRLEESERLDLVAQLESLEISLEDGDLEDFGMASAVLQRVSERLGQRTAEGKVRVQDALRDAGIGRGHPAFRKIQDALDHGDFLTAYEYLGIAREGHDLALAEGLGAVSRSTEELRHFDELFIKRARWETELHTLYEAQKQSHSASSAPSREILGHADKLRSRFKAGPYPETKTQLSQVVRAITSASVLWGVDLRAIQGKPAKTGGDLVSAWFALKDNLKRGAQFDDEQEQRLLQILDLIGFHVQKITVNRRVAPIHVQLECNAIRDRAESLVPTFGSAVAGRYQLLVYSERPGEDRMMSDLSDSLAEPTIVLFFGVPSDKRRRDFARLCRERGRSVILLHDLILLYLCTVRGSRLQALFGCTLPFTYAQPYSAHPGTVAPEMFYGRDFERRAIAQRLGSCFIYGGRQLGKTVLLKRVAETEHHPHEGRIALWLDLKDAGIGIRRPLDHIWSLLAEQLAPYGVIPATFNSSESRPEILLTHAEDWLNQDAGRQILLLLDEADIFLQRDGIAESGRAEDAFPHSTLLKGAIDRSNARFKVVFAGLHNVVRTTRSSNNPLSQFGQPICIGPLFERGGVREARELIAWPLHSIGYRFKEANLVWRILYRTNYYPSLIQLYCLNLVAWLNSAERLNKADGPPYEITSDDIEYVYHSRDLRDEIRRRFRMTLDLDARYEVVAYSIALAVRWDTGSRGLEEGFEVSQIFAQVLDWWPDGFRNTDSESFPTLLDEMVGLGVLRSMGSRRYSLRSPNVLLLLGTIDDIVAALERRRDPPTEYLPSTFRGPYPSGLDVRLSLRNPLTEQQLSDLRHIDSGGKVFVACGSEASGLGDFGKMLRSSFGAGFAWTLPRELDEETFAACLDTPVKGDGFKILHVPPDVSWQDGWLTAARSWLSRLPASRKQARVVFGAGPVRLRQMIANGLHLRPEMEFVHFISLRPWHRDAIWNWVEEINESGWGAIDSSCRTRIATVTDGWPLLLASLFRHAHSRGFDWSTSITDFEQRLDHPGVASRILATSGLIAPSAEYRVLRTLAGWNDSSHPSAERDPLGKEELAELVAGVSVEDIGLILEWASRLALVSMSGRGRWLVAPAPARLLKAAGSELA